MKSAVALHAELCVIAADKLWKLMGRQGKKWWAILDLNQ
jgi:hypothetical protein